MQLWRVVGKLLIVGSETLGVSIPRSFDRHTESRSIARSIANFAWASCDFGSGASPGGKVSFALHSDASTEAVNACG